MTMADRTLGSIESLIEWVKDNPEEAAKRIQILRKWDMRFANARVRIKDARGAIATAFDGLRSDLVSKGIPETKGALIKQADAWEQILDAIVQDWFTHLSAPHRMAFFVGIKDFLDARDEGEQELENLTFKEPEDG